MALCYYNNKNSQNCVVHLSILLYYQYKSDVIINNHPSATKCCYCSLQVTVRVLVGWCTS